MFMYCSMFIYFFCPGDVHVYVHVYVLVFLRPEAPPAFLIALSRSVLGSTAGAGSWRTRPTLTIAGGAAGGGGGPGGALETCLSVTGSTGAGGGGGAPSSLSSEDRPPEALSRDLAAMSWSVKARFSSSWGTSRGGIMAEGFRTGMLLLFETLLMLLLVLLLMMTMLLILLVSLLVLLLLLCLLL